MQIFSFQVGGIDYFIYSTDKETARQQLERLYPETATGGGYDKASIAPVESVPDGTSEEFIIRENEQFSGIDEQRKGDTLDRTERFQQFQKQFLPDFMQPFTRARQAVGEAIPGLNIGGGFGRSIANVFANPLANLATIGTLTGGQAQPITFTGASPFQQSRTAFQNLLNQQSIIDPISGRTVNPFLQDIQNPDVYPGTGVTQNKFAQEAAKLALGAARGQYGGLGERFLPNINQLLQGFEESPGFGTEGGFLPYLQQRLGLRFE